MSDVAIRVAVTLEVEGTEDQPGRFSNNHLQLYEDARFIALFGRLVLSLTRSTALEDLVEHFAISNLSADAATTLEIVPKMSRKFIGRTSLCLDDAGLFLCINPLTRS